MAGNTLIAHGQAVAVATSPMTVTPDRARSRTGARPGRNSETWTPDGDRLNDLTFCGGIEDGRPLFREVSHRHEPLPHFAATMLLTHIPALVEASYRIAPDTPVMTITSIEAATPSGNGAVRFRYEFTQFDDEVARRGEAVAAIVGGRLYMISFEAPAICSFDRDLPGARATMAAARIG